MISLYLLNYLLVQPKMKKFLGGPKHLKKKTPSFVFHRNLE